jgi:hypothetical protein
VKRLSRSNQRHVSSVFELLSALLDAEDHD